MRKVEFNAYGAPEAVAQCIEAPDVGAPGSRESGRSGKVVVLPNEPL